MLTQQSLQRTPLYQDHLGLKAKMVAFGGWDMPVQYPDGILSEYEQTRKAVTVFDICHMGEFIIEGDVNDSGLNNIVTHSISDMPVKTSRYGFILNEQGATIDDLIVFRGIPRFGKKENPNFHRHPRVRPLLICGLVPHIRCQKSGSARSGPRGRLRRHFCKLW